LTILQLKQVLEFICKAEVVLYIRVLAAICSMNKLFTLIVVLLLSISSFAQHQERRMFMYNACFGGITAGVGAVINKPKDLNWRKAFLKGIWQGSIGGALNYSGKKMLHQVSQHQEVAYGLPAKVLHAAGTSIVENAALGAPFLQNWSIDYGPVRFDFSISGSRRFKARFLPMSINAVVGASKHHRLDLKTTLLTGSIAFGTHNGNLVVRRGVYVYGVSYDRAFAYTATPSDSVRHEIIAHELVHQFQYRDYQVFNSWLKPLEAKVKSPTLQTIFSKYVYFDIPYLWPAYLLEGRKEYPYNYGNFFELEADHFSMIKY
jgi:hypothetical protein